MPESTDLFRQVVAISRDYLGPTAERFMARQVATHLKKAPEELLPGDLDTLVDWVRLSVSLLTNDQRLVDTFTSRLLELGKERSR